MSINKEDLLSKIISSNEGAFLAKTSDNPVNTDGFKKLIAILITFSYKVSFNAFAFHVRNLDVNNIDFNIIMNNLDDVIKTKLQINNHFIVNEKFEVIEEDTYNPRDSSEARDAYKNASMNNTFIILIINKRYVVYFNGLESSNSTFAAEADLKRFDERRELNEIFEVIKEYKEYIKSKYVYYKFFTEKTTLIRLFGDAAYYQHRNLLRNKPENLLREDLRKYLTDKINKTFNFSRENQLDSNKRMDINVEDDLGNYYFFEIKWLGTSIHHNGNEKGTTYDESTVFDGLEQTLNYILELKSQNKSVKLGCLVFFDARDNKTALCYDWDKIREDLKEHQSCFRNIDDLHLENTHPM